MIRIFFGFVIVVIFVCAWVFFAYVIRDQKEPRWFLKGGTNHYIALIMALIITVIIVFGMAQPVAFLKFIFG